MSNALFIILESKPSKEPEFGDQNQFCHRYTSNGRQDIFAQKYYFCWSNMHVSLLFRKVMTISASGIDCTFIKLEIEVAGVKIEEMSKSMLEIKELHDIFFHNNNQNIIFLSGYLTTKFKIAKNTCWKVEVDNNNCICFGITRLDKKFRVTHMWN